MTNPTSNYAWQMPTPTDLVTDLPADFEVFGQAVDNSLWNVGYGQAGKNKIINGDFGIWQRGTSFTPSVGSGWNYNSDRFRWLGNGTGGARTISRQSFTAGTAPVAGYESTYFLRFDSTSASTGATNNLFSQPIEDVRTFAGNTVTLSFWAKAAAAITLPTVSIIQDFGGGGSSGVVVTAASSQAITTSWVRYTYTVAIPSIAGKTIGTSPSLEVRLSLPLNSTFTFDIWGVQLEYGSKATPFQTASGGSPQAELAMCQRYYYRNTGGETYSHYGIGMSISTTFGYALINLPVTMRVKPTAVDFGNVGITDDVNYQLAASALVINWGSPSTVQVSVQTAASQVQYRTAYLTNQNNTAGFIGFSAEL
jgi:hypothetical protein